MKRLSKQHKYLFRLFYHFNVYSPRTFRSLLIYLHMLFTFCYTIALQTVFETCCKVCVMECFCCEVSDVCIWRAEGERLSRPDRKEPFRWIGGREREGPRPLSSALGNPAAPPVFRWSSMVRLTSLWEARIACDRLGTPLALRALRPGLTPESVPNEQTSETGLVDAVWARETWYFLPGLLIPKPRRFSVTAARTTGWGGVPRATHAAFIST